MYKRSTLSRDDPLTNLSNTDRSGCTERAPPRASKLAPIMLPFEGDPGHISLSVFLGFGVIATILVQASGLYLE